MDKQADPDQIAHTEAGWSGSTFLVLVLSSSELWVINLLVLIHFGNMKRSGFQSKAIPKVWVSFYYIIMFTCCVETTK